jgi:two-component system phosphate regulon sensor histidine kinase PhoR
MRGPAACPFAPGLEPMSRKRRLPIVAAYVLSLLVTISLLVVWVVYVVQSVARVRALAGRVGVGGEGSHWWVLGLGCTLLGLLIAGLTWQLAQALAARSYSVKQDEFLSNVTHELKSPLAAIKLHAQTLQQGDLPAEQQQRSLELVLQQADRMSRLVDDVLESSRLVARKQPLALQPIAIEHFCAEYFPAAEARLESQVTLKWRVDCTSVVYGTYDALERVLDNLLDNAARFSRRGGEVRCGIADDAGKVRIEVEDDGVGIPHRDLEKIFDRFYQVGNERDPRRRGTGLGLSIVAGLVHEMRGTVEAFSHDGRPGARFVVELPAAEPAGEGQTFG